MSSAGQMGERCRKRFQIDSETLSMSLSVLGFLVSGCKKLEWVNVNDFMGNASYGAYPICKGCSVCSRDNGCVNCQPKLFLFLRRERMRQYGECLHDCPAGYYGMRSPELNMCSMGLNTQKPQLCSLPTNNQCDQGLRLPISWKCGLNLTARSEPASCATRDSSVKDLPDNTIAPPNQAPAPRTSRSDTKLSRVFFSKHCIIVHTIVKQDFQSSEAETNSDVAAMLLMKNLIKCNCCCKDTVFRTSALLIFTVNN
ncbi:R-spondin-2 Roof plate-specific spondin-2 XRspo2 [Collichthys lucidus]|uniref:R-spondin-2 Roof plate-specific spondin-2 XRspo2 n=1 Tax=Collichthys lucidus TaxID=240159 RepID=A0A4U5V2M0_COLLU|nr:R-spondin-2 Roof plate-specific spondin-2 XRspo2 [Collichthys lucidus]